MVLTDKMYNQLIIDINDLQGNMKLLAEQVASIKEQLKGIKKSVDFIESFDESKT